jgi:hypothetical protein
LLLRRVYVGLGEDKPAGQVRCERGGQIEPRSLAQKSAGLRPKEFFGKDHLPIDIFQRVQSSVKIHKAEGDVLKLLRCISLVTEVKLPLRFVLWPWSLRQRWPSEIVRRFPKSVQV